jgi:hypothetical protein
MVDEKTAGELNQIAWLGKGRQPLLNQKQKLSIRQRRAVQAFEQIQERVRK